LLPPRVSRSRPGPVFCGWRKEQKSFGSFLQKRTSSFLHRSPNLIRRVLVHSHIYKNAGASIDRLLWQSFGDAFAMLEPACGHHAIGHGVVQRFLDEHAHIKAISSHRIYPPLRLPGALPILFLRHPIERARSVYRFARAHSVTPDHKIARERDFCAYTRWSLATHGEGAVLRNHQVYHLSSAAYRTAEPTEADLTEAKATLAALPAFGLVRRFEESCRLFNARYRPFLPAMRLANWSENTTGDPTITEADAIGQVCDELDDATYRSLLSANALDLELYAFAKLQFDRHLHQLGRIGDRIGTGLGLLAGRVRQRVMEPALYRRGRSAGLGSRQFPTEPAYYRI